MPTVRPTRRRADVAFLVPTLNSAATLDATLAALRSQQDVDVNIVVADSGSTDGTQDVCRRWEVPTIYVPPGNMYAAINAGLRECRAEWLGYLNSDDWIYSDSALRLTDHADAVGADVVYGNCDFSDGVGRYLFSLKAARPQHLVSLFRVGVMGFQQPAALFRRHVYETVGGFDESFFLTADGAFYLRALNTGFRFALLDGAQVASFRVHPAQLTQRRSELMKREVQALQALAGRARRVSDYSALVEWRLANVPNYLMRMLRGRAGKSSRTVRATEIPSR